MSAFGRHRRISRYLADAALRPFRCGAFLFAGVNPAAPTRVVRKAHVGLCEPSAGNNQRQARLIWRGGVQTSLAASPAACLL
jgi:hypothetical protein